jgi:hypothetical protein
MHEGDRKMFAPALSGEARSIEAQVCAVLGESQAGASATGLADRLVRRGLAIGSKASLIKRLAQMLDEMERAAQVERIPDGRYRVVKARR